MNALAKRALKSGLVKHYEWRSENTVIIVTLEYDPIRHVFKIKTNGTDTLISRAFTPVKKALKRLIKKHQLA